MPSDTNFTCELELTGEFISNIQSYNINSSYLTPTDEWSFTVYDDEAPWELRRKFRPLQPVKLYIDGQLQVIGRIDKIEGTGSGSALRVSGRDYLAALVDGSADPSVRVNAKMDIGDAILSVTKAFGITKILGTNTTRNIVSGAVPYRGGPPRDFKSAKVEDFKIPDNEGAFEWCNNRIAARHGYTLQPAGTRDTILLVEPEYRQAPLYELKRVWGAPIGGHILSATASRDYASVPTVTVATGRGGSAAGAQVPGLRNEVSTFGVNAPSDIGKNSEVRRIVYSEDGLSPLVIDWRFLPKNEGIRGNNGLLYRPMFYVDKDSKNLEQLAMGVRRAIAERLRPTLEYHCSVRGHEDPITGAIYAVDTIARVDDTVEDVHENLWLMERTLSNDGHGPRTELTFIRPGAFQL
jgi:prophage tail gpP-like protein